MPTRFRDDPTNAPFPRARSRARTLRKQMTEPERRLWWHLRHRLPTNGTHFRRQVPIDFFVVDFCCLKARLVIEVDGNQHGFDDNRHRDAARTCALEASGYRVLRSTNCEVMTSIDVVLDTIFAALGPTPPTPGPSPQGGGESAL
jgi:very-short-patch-repair endonuclease